MSRDPSTCNAKEPLEAAAERMRTEIVGAFPVLHHGHLVGILSETDILRAITELAGLGTETCRITAKVSGPRAPGALYEVVDLCRRYGLELRAVLTHRILEDSATLTTVRVRGERVEDLIEALWKAGFDVVDRA